MLRRKANTHEEVWVHLSELVELTGSRHLGWYLPWPPNYLTFSRSWTTESLEHSSAENAQWYYSAEERVQTVCKMAPVLLPQIPEPPIRDDKSPWARSVRNFCILPLIFVILCMPAGNSKPFVPSWTFFQFDGLINTLKIVWRYSSKIYSEYIRNFQNDLKSTIPWTLKRMNLENLFWKGFFSS